ncbi:hypothetical protein H4J02_01015 [Protaetiibacter sp. SSC-01]|uniref:hypothetical protein n=1 Tax=Protaetiibacter sp. SSC-01 TaxID=2759943 RepID=UPI001656BB95|nr:hypothetical protein [Protaetiibacter sp. SSC-01]QNO37659.1 hypothetical protein H4J02_01015 [Protaetiibacter sp. SSC-01]
MTTAPVTPRLSLADRIAFAVIAALAALLGLIAVADGVWRTIALAAGNGPVDLIAFAPLPDNVGDITGATVASDAIGEGARALLVTASALSLVVAAVTSAAVVVFLVMTARGTPFHRVLYPVVLTAGLVMSLGGIVSAGIDGLGRMMAGGDLGEPYIPGFELNLGPWAFGFVVLAAAYVIRTGQRLQRDAEGLV